MLQKRTGNKASFGFVVRGSDKKIYNLEWK